MKKLNDIKNELIIKCILIFIMNRFEYEKNT